MKEAIALAQSQGWRVDVRAPKVRFFPPGGGPVVQDSVHYTTADRKSLFNRLKSAGLVLSEPVPHPKTKPQEETMAQPVPFPAPALDLKSLSEALDACISMVHELADKFVEFRDAQGENLGRELPALRARLQTAENTLVQQMEALSKMARASDTAHEGFTKRLSALEAATQSLTDRLKAIPAEPVDPIAEFRKRLQR